MAAGAPVTDIGFRVPSHALEVNNFPPPPPDDYNRVVLDPWRDPDSPDEAESDYINASYVDVSETVK